MTAPSKKLLNILQESKECHIPTPRLSFEALVMNWGSFCAGVSEYGT